MKKYVFSLLILLIIVLSFNACKQCNNSTVEVSKIDSVGIPKIAAINESIRKDSLNPNLYYQRAQLYEASEDYTSAATDMFFALTLDSVRPEFYVYAANLFKKTGDIKRGVALMNKAIATDSMNTTFYVKAAELIYIDKSVEGNYISALDYLNAAIEKDPQNADIYFYKGNIFKEVGDTAKAISSFQTATELDPKFYHAYVQLGLLLTAKKDKNAERYLDNAIKVGLNPEDALYAKADILKDAGVSLYDAGKYEKAVAKLSEAAATFRKVIDLNHKNTEAYMGAGFCYYQMDSLTDAYKFYDLATKIDPTYAGAYFSKGLCAEDLGRKEEAISLYRDCLNLDPQFKRAATHLSNLQKAK